MNEAQKMAAEQFANIEAIKFMLLDIWSLYLCEKDDIAAEAMKHRDRHLQHLQLAVDNMPDSFVRHALLSHAENNWKQIFSRLEAEGVSLSVNSRP